MESSMPDIFYQITKPILFHTGLDETPYAGVGTGFLSSFQNHYYLFTALHVVKGENLDNLMVFQNNESDESIPFDASYHVSNPELLDSDYCDFSILRVATEKLALNELSSMKTIQLDKLSSDWKTVADDYQLAFVGFPTEAREVDYDKLRIASTQHLLVGHLVGASKLKSCFELEVTDLNGVSDLNGFSGSPVFALPRKGRSHLNAAFCGMLIRGTATSGRAHFIDAIRLKQALEQAQGS